MARATSSLPDPVSNQHRRVRWRDSLDLAQHTRERPASADDLLELELAADLVFEIELLARELGVELLDPLI
jgi:hypothetical protein